MSDHHLSELAYSELPLHESVAAGIRDAGFTHCTPIQARTLPIALAGKDVAGQAQTGTGKTAAFLVAAFNRLMQRPPPENQRGPRVLVLAPTRELAVQIHADATTLARHTGLHVCIAHGGTDYDKQRDAITAGVDVLIGTPGRVIDYFKQGVFDLRSAEVMVLDEADRMFDLGFIKDIRYVMRRLPPVEQRLSMLFSATLSHRVLELAYEHMNDPELIRIEPEKVTADRVRQVIYYPSNEEKLPLLVGLLRKLDTPRSMVFVNTRREAEFLRDQLVANGIEAEALSGDVPQNKRLRMLRDFQAGKVPVLIGTDVASRGLHVPEVSHVFNYDLPQDAEDYVHRIGRTARAGAAGDAISFGCERYVMSLPEIEAYIGNRIPVGTVEPDVLAEVRRTPRPRRRNTSESGPGGRSGGRDRERSRPPARRSAGDAGKPAGRVADAPKPPASEPAAAAEEAAGSEADGQSAPAKKRRRRRRRPPADPQG
ncbi:MAG: DEAD/DEAH box helicase [Gammaproteobacteria bacterium]|nr:DEAD/DEAH box helicase [Gammaproteobacteria bacterium]TVQ47210.1 MAG: DEAD/DEAH box helicase [Gammaproteobacteria bacterium]